MEIRGELTTVVAEGSRSADSGDSDIALSQFLGQSANVLDDSGIQGLVEDHRLGFTVCWKKESAIRAEQTFSQT